MVEETRLILEITEEALGEVDKEAEEDEQKVQTGIPGNQMEPTTAQHFGQMNVLLMLPLLLILTNFGLFDYIQQLSLYSPRPKEPSRAHLKAVQAVTKILLESPNLDVSRLNTAWVRRTAYKPEDFTDAERQTVVKLVKALGPYTPKRVPSSSGKTSPPTANAASMIRIVLLSNHILQYTGYSQYTRRYAPAPSIASLHPIPLGAASIYDTLCWKTPNNFDIYDSDYKPITSVKTATKNRNDTFTNFFDLDAIYGICRKYKLRFAFRYVFFLAALHTPCSINFRTFR